MKRHVPILLVICAAIAAVVSQFSSILPDGLEYVARNQGFALKAKPNPLLTVPAPDYSFASIGNAQLSLACAGLLGVVMAFGISIIISKLLIKTTQRKNAYKRGPE